MPFAFTPNGEPMGEMTLKTLARGRMCVQKVIAEPDKRAHPSTKQGGLRGNSISFPQQKVELLDSNELPADAERSCEFFSKTLLIALAGADKEDLHNAKWAQIPRDDYVTAAHFCTSHGMAYDGMAVNEDRARVLFAAHGRTSDAILQQAVPVEVDGDAMHRVDGPGDTGGAGVAPEHGGPERVHADASAHEHCVSVDGVVVEDACDEEEDSCAPDLNAALPEEAAPGTDMPPMHFCADDLTSGTMDQLQAVRKVAYELQELRKAALAHTDGEAASGAPHRARVHILQQAVREMSSRRFATGISELADQAGAKAGVRLPAEAYAVHTVSKPLSMYTAATWAMCFPECFPYGDGVFGLPSAKPLTFQQWQSFLLLREELCFNVTPSMVAEARAWVAPADKQGSDVAASGGCLPCPTACRCVQCKAACQPFTLPHQPRWGRSRELLCAVYDSGRRMEQIKKAKTHVLRSGYQEKLERICNASAEKVEAAINSLGERASYRDVIRSSDCDSDLNDALKELIVFTSEIVGSDGARGKLRYEQNGYCLAFGQAGGFLTPNLSDTRSPLVIVLHGGGVEERYARMGNVTLRDAVAPPRLHHYSAHTDHTP
jgi:hypothetical protein